MQISPDETILWQSGFLKVNATIGTTWALMAVLGGGSWLITRRLRTDARVSRWQSALEIAVTAMVGQIAETSLRPPEKYLGFIGTLFLFIAVANVATILPGYEPPTGSLSTTAALACCVFYAVPWFGISENGVWGYLKTYAEPNVLMIPFNFLSELTRTVALAVRLFGNIMSGTLILGILLSIAPLIFPIFMTALGLVTGLVQAYIFSLLAAVFVAAAARSREPRTSTPEPGAHHG